jgi:hypothetical protein
MPPLLRVVLLAKVVDSLYVIEMAMRHFYMRAEMGKNAGRKEALVDQDVCRLEIALAAPSSPRRADPQRSPPRASWAQNEIGAAASGASKGVHQRSLFLSLGSSPT